MVGRTIGRYRIDEQIGRGGMGTVYRAVDETLDRIVAIKVLNGDLLDQDSVERFRREAVTLARLSHPRIGAIHELTRDGHNLLMVMEFISGETFEKLIERSAPLPVADAARLCAQILDGLQYAHNAGVIHRDLKPSNVIVTPQGDVKIMDFGIARVQGSDHLTSVGFMVGTPAYMSPEQVRGEEVDPRMDLYSIAVVLYRLLTHHLPFQGDTAIAMIHSQLSNPPTPARQFRADLPDWIVATLARGLAKAPADRFQTAAEFRKALENGLAGKMAIADILGPSDAETMAPTRTPPAMLVPSGSGAASVPQPSLTASSAQPSASASSVHAPPVAGASPGGSLAPPPSASNPQPALPKTEATVTLRAPHLAGAGILVAVLVIGIGVLAFIALQRQSTSPPTASGSTEKSVTQETPSAAPATPPPATSVITPPPATTSPAAPVPPSAASLRTTSPRDNTLTGDAVPPADRQGAAVAAGPARGRAAPPPTPAPAPAPATPAVPAAASAPAEHFQDVKVLVAEGTRGREVDARLALEPGALVIRGNNGTVLRTLAYPSVSALTYIRSRRPRAQNGPHALAVPDTFGGSGFLGGARHWLTLQTPGEFLILRLGDRNVIAIMRAVEARTGLKVLRVQD